MLRFALVSGLSLALTIAMGSSPNATSARKQSELRYPFEQVWNAALRMVRVDMRLPVTDRDAEAGYLLFEYLDHGKRFPASLELVRAERGQRPITKTVVQVQGMPSYVEQMLFDKLERKLRDEYGEPLEPVKPAPQKPVAPKPPADDGELPPDDGSLAEP